MALKKPLVISSGEIQQLQTGDTLDAPQSGGDIISLTNDEASPIVIGTPVYIDANDGVKKARANASGTSKVMGLVYDASISNGAAGIVLVQGVLSATTTQWDAVTGLSGGLTAGVTYFLDPATAGKITNSAPATVGQYVVEIGVGVSATEMRVNIRRRILL